MINDFIINSLKNIHRNKKNITLISIITILFILLFIDAIFMKNIFSYIDCYMHKNLEFRSFYTYKFSTEDNEEQTINKIKKIEHISDAYNSKYSRYYLKTSININNLSGDIMLYRGSANITPKSIKGKEITELKSGEIICPYYFYPDEEVYNFNISEAKIINPDEIMDLEFDAFYIRYIPNGKIVNGIPDEDQETLSKRFKIVGIYDNSLLMNNNNDCFGVEEDIKLFSEASNTSIEYNKDLYDHTIKVVVDKSQNLNKVRNSLKENGFEVNEDEIAEFDKATMTVIISLSISIFIIINCTLLFLLYSYLRKKIISESKYLGLLKACGYTNKQVVTKELIENSIILLISFIISFSIFSIIFFFIENKIVLFKALRYTGFRVKNSLTLLIVLLTTIILISTLISLRLLKKNLNNPIVDILGDD